MFDLRMARHGAGSAGVKRAISLFGIVVQFLN
jgi:hypothetical protein